MKPYRMLFAFVLLMFVVSLACSGGTNTPAPAATNAPSLPNQPAATSAPAKPIQPAATDAPLKPIQPAATDAPAASGNSALVTFTDENKLLTIDIPGDWKKEHSTIPDANGNSIAYVDSFTAPDSTAKIESFVYNDGTPFVANQNGKFALYLLNTYYSKTGKQGDIHISSDSIQADGSERLTWKSTGYNESGVSFFELRGSDNKTFLLFTAYWVNGVPDTMMTTINNVIASYKIP
jgi:hypothetical protein